MTEILVAGATGRIGSAVVAELISRGIQPRVLVRDANRVPESWQGRVTSFVGDLDDPPSLTSPVEGLDSLLIVSPVNPAQRQQQGNLAGAAAKTGSPTIVKISGLATSLNSSVDSGRWHAETEADIQALGLPYTFLRPYFFMQNLGFSIPSARRDGIIRSGVGDADIAMIDVEDIAGVCAQLLTGEVRRENEALALTGSVPLSYRQVAAQMSEVFGQAITYQPLSTDEVKQSLVKSGQPDWHVQILLQFNLAFRDGAGATVSSATADILGHTPRRLKQYLVTQLGGVATAGNNPFPSE